MAYISVSHITLVSHMRSDDMHSVLLVEVRPFKELRPLPGCICDVFVAFVG
jgi:hypothetical protein